MPRYATLLAALLPALVAPAHAQETGRTYQVEVVVFEQSASTAEVLALPEPPVPVSAEALEADVPPGEPGPDPAAADTPADAAAAPLLPERFGAPLDPRRLDNIARALNARGYRVLWHQAWTQPASGLKADEAVPLGMLAALGGGAATPDLAGSVELTAGRYLHLGLELSTPAPGEGRYALAQRRRVLINDLNYFDHPRLGAITVVTVPAAQPAAPTP